MTLRKNRVTTKKDQSKKPASREERGYSSVDLPTELWKRVQEDAARRFLKPSQLVRQILAKHYGMVPGDTPAQT